MTQGKGKGKGKGKCCALCARRKLLESLFRFDASSLTALGARGRGLWAHVTCFQRLRRAQARAAQKRGVPAQQAHRAEDYLVELSLGL